MSLSATLNVSPGAMDLALLMSADVEVSSLAPAPKASTGSPNWATAGWAMKMLLARQSSVVSDFCMIDELIFKW